jgi:glutamate-1-semialdehyde 2,1-aminomutase
MSSRRVRELFGREAAAFEAANPRSRELFGRTGGSLLGGVPMSWMMKWAEGFPLFAASAEGSTITDVDGHVYADFYLGDTGAMTGHAPAVVADTIAAQAARSRRCYPPRMRPSWARRCASASGSRSGR